MPANSQTELGAMLATHNFDGILGTRESNWIDFKSQPYSADPPGSGKLSKHGRYELCKDVAAFANFGSGCIVIGFTTTKDPLRDRDVATQYSFIDNDLAKIDSYRSALRNGIFPTIQEPRIEWFNPDNSDAGILLIEITPQSNESKPFILRRFVDGDETIEAVSIPTRNGDSTDWATPEGIHSELRAGRMAPLRETQPQNDIASDATDLIADVEGSKNWDSSPTFWLQAIPHGSLDPSVQLFGVNGLATQLQNFSPLRTNGFNFHVFGTPEFVGPNLVYGGRDVAYLRLNSTGLFTLGILASPSVIGWGITAADATPAVIVNGTVVIEETVEFCRFVQQVLKPSTPSLRWTYRLTCHRFKSSNVRLGPSQPRLINMISPVASNLSIEDVWTQNIASTDTVAQDALEIIRKFYELFALGVESIPYQGSNGINVESFLTMTD